MDVDARAEGFVNMDICDGDEGMDVDVDVIGKDDVSNCNPANILPESSAVINTIRQWLEPTPYLHEGGEYRRHLASHVEGTGQWLMATETYRKWHEGSDHGLLWIKGIPGSGKSVFAAMLADVLGREGHPVLFFFFRQIIDANHKPVHMLRDWLAQVLEYSPVLQRNLKTYLDEECDDFDRKLECLSVDDLWQHLKTALAHMPRVYLVADALDEMDKGNDECLQSLARLGLWKPGQVKVVITSRPVNAVEAPLREFPALRIRLEERIVDTDIATYVQHSLMGSAISAEDRALIKQAVPGRANGLFLYAKLAMDAFLEPGAEVRQVLGKLPADLHALYTDLLREHTQTSGISDDIQRLLLCWVTHATRPLRLLEMAEMLSVTYNAAGHHQDLKSARALVRVACGPLLEILPDETVSVMHHSLTEFLVGSTQSAKDVAKKGTFSFPVLRPGPTHEQLALSCLGYLQLSGCLEKLSGTARTEEDSIELPPYTSPPRHHRTLRLEFPFAEYACRNWAIHAAKSFDAGWESAALISAIDGLLGAGHRLDAWLSIGWWPRATMGIAPSHVAARYGLTPYFQHILGRQDTANAISTMDIKSQTPLFYAAEEGHADTVQLLIAAGAHPNPDNYAGLKPLHLAANSNQPGAVVTLLAAGVDPLTEKTRENPGRRCGTGGGGTKGDTPLMYACRAGHLAVVEAFLPYLKDIGPVQRALCWASRAGQAKVVKRLIQHPGVDVNAEVQGATALFNACCCDDVEAIEALVLAGADATIPCRAGFDGFGGPRRAGQDPMFPLEAFCSSPNHLHYKSRLQIGELEHGLKLLLQAGADIHRRDRQFKTPLHHAAGRPSLLRLLLRAGADPNVESSDGGTLLHTKLAGDEGWEVIKLLVEEGKADVNKRRHSDGKTPLFGFLQSWELGVCLRFIREFGPDCTIADYAGSTPLHQAASLRDSPTLEEVIDALLAGGARINQRNRKGEMAIHVAEDMSVVEFLTRRGADLEAKDFAGATPLMRSLRTHRHNRRRNITHLLSIGARLDTRDFKGRALVHQALSSLPLWGLNSKSSMEGLQQMLDLGLDVTQVDYAGNTVLHELMQRGSQGRGTNLRLSVFEDLLRRGADPNAVSHCGQTVFHVLGAKEYDPILLGAAIAACKKGAVDLPDHEGRRPIHLAASVSEGTVARLVSAGVDVSAPSHSGLTPLHFAASAGESNIVGLLLSVIITDARYRDAAQDIIDAADGEGRTPLYYACLSGRPESVALLLNAGAEVKPWTKKLLEACSQFEQKDRREAESRVVKIDHTDVTEPRTFADFNRANFPHFSTRLGEILGMLVDHGLDHFGTDQYGWTHLQSAIKAVADSDLDHTARSFSKLRAEILGEAAMAASWVPATAAFTRRWVENRRDAASRAFGEVDPVSLAKGDEKMQEALFLRLLGKREFDLVEATARTAEWDLCLPSRDGWTIFHALIALGHALLLARIATEDDIKRIDDVEWRKEQGDITKGSPNPTLPGSITPFVLAACQRDMPNMDVLRVLVEKLNASVNASRLKYVRPNEAGNPQYRAGSSPLRHLAKGKRWWQAHEALPYLLSQTPDLEARDHNGRTALHNALDGKQPDAGPFQKEAAKLLVAAGADVNAVTNSGETCLAMARNDVEMVHLLISHGANVTAPGFICRH
jgi:ankyrin repeat protein/KaiC/GvpD/RAD55 family RecA-like ATPase